MLSRLFSKLIGRDDREAGPVQDDREASPLAMRHTITIEPLTAELRRVACLQRAKNEWAVVERVEGRLVQVCTTAISREAGRELAGSYARTYGAAFDDREAAPAPIVITGGQITDPERLRAQVDALRVYERAGIGYFA